MRTNQLKGHNGPRYRHETHVEKPFETIEVKKLTPVIGAEIHQIDLSKPILAKQQEELHRALAENQVIFFRDQDISKENHVTFGRIFGDLHIHPAAPHVTNIPEMMLIQADRNSPRANGEVWHTDVSCDQEPPMGSILHIYECAL